MAADIFSEEQRSYVMSRISAKNTKPELRVRSYLHRAGFRFRIHGRKLPGNPDIVLAKHKTVVFVHGCFWHRHEGCPRANMPASRVEFWQSKFDKNVARDRRSQITLAEMGWSVIVVWECEISTVATREERLPQLIRELGNPTMGATPPDQPSAK